MAKGIIRRNNGTTSRSSSGYSVNTGLLEDLQSKIQYEFEQPFFQELGLAEGTKVNYNLVKDSNSKEIAVGLESLEKGVVVSVDGDTGILTEKASGNSIDFIHSRSKECNIVAGSTVRYEKVDFNGKPVATSLTLIK